MSKYISMLSEIDRIIEEVNDLNLEDGELFRSAIQKRLEYIDLLIQAKRTKASFLQMPTGENTRQVKVNRTEDGGNVVYGTATITANDIRFGILRFSKISDISRSLQPNSKIMIKYGREIYQGSVPKSVLGRINGLAGLYSEHPEISTKRRITVEYDFINKIMTIQ